MRKLFAFLRWVAFGRDEDHPLIYGTKPMTVTITPTDNGRFAIVNRYGDQLKDYARARDARRGAARLGYAVA